MTGKRASNRHSRVVGRFVKIPEPLTDGKIRCPACSKALKPTKVGGIRRHIDRYGDPCPFMGGCRGGMVQITEAPPVVFRQPGPAPAPSRRGAWRRPEGEPSRLDAGSNCSECGKWLPGERSLCGACYVKRGR